MYILCIKKTKKNIKNRLKLKKLSKKNLLGGQTLNLFEYYQKYCYKQDKFLVYICKYRKGTASFCGGLSDRIRGIVGLFILSLITSNCTRLSRKSVNQPNIFTPNTSLGKLFNESTVWHFVKSLSKV